MTQPIDPLLPRSASVALTEELALTKWDHGQVTVGVAAVQIASVPLTKRKTIALKTLNTSTTLYIGNSSTVTSGTGYPLENGGSIELDLGPGAQVWAISTVAAQILAYVEIA